MTAPLFHEIYNTYYRAVEKLIRAAAGDGLDTEKAMALILETAFSDSFLYILDAVKNQQWQVLTRDFQTPLRRLPKRPLSLLERSWLEAVRQDARMRLFEPIGKKPEQAQKEQASENSGNSREALYQSQDFYTADLSGDGDPYEEEGYRRIFQTVLEAVRDRRHLRIRYDSGKGKQREETYFPHSLEYSEKDDKFRLLAKGQKGLVILNLARIRECSLCEGKGEVGAKCRPSMKKKRVVLELTDQRNGLERCMMHFADLEKETVQVSEEKYRIELFYRSEDETEILIRVLSFGPLLKAVEPQSFVSLIIERLRKQKAFAAFFPR